MSKIKLEQYRIFNEVASELSFSKAARNLFISQPAVSQVIKQIEKELKVQLFIRNGKKISLTSEAEILYNYTKDALELIASAENKLLSYNDLKGGNLILAAGDSFSEFFLKPYLTKFHKTYPNISVKIINRTSSEVLELLNNGQIDLGFMSKPNNLDSLIFHECFSIQDIFVGKKKSSKVYNFKDISKLPLILLESTSTSRQYIDKQFAKEKVILHPKMELGAHTLLLECVKESLGVACVVKEFSIDYLNNNEVFELKTNPTLPKRMMGYAYLKRKTLSSASLKFIDLLKKDQV
ncbi:MAG: LysR family transcriptional regulator [Anaerorhabdus sp.]